MRQNYQFLEELRGGELVVIKSGFLAVGEKYFRFLHQMYNDVSGKMVATSDCVPYRPASIKARAWLLTLSSGAREVSLGVGQRSPHAELGKVVYALKIFHHGGHREHRKKQGINIASVSSVTSVVNILELQNRKISLRR